MKVHRVEVGGYQTWCGRMLVKAVADRGTFFRESKVSRGMQVLRVTTEDNFTCEGCRRRERVNRRVEQIKVEAQARRSSEASAEQLGVERAQIARAA